MPSYFVQTKHILEFLRSRGIRRVHDPDNPFAFIGPSGDLIFILDTTIDIVDIGHIYEDWERANCKEPADELVEWIESRPIWY